MLCTHQQDNLWNASLIIAIQPGNRKDLESMGFKLNPHDPCIAKGIFDGKQHTVAQHVDKQVTLIQR